MILAPMHFCVEIWGHEIIQKTIYYYFILFLKILQHGLGI